MRQSLSFVLAGATAALVSVGVLRVGLGDRAAVAAEPDPGFVAQLERSLVPVASPAPLELPTLRTADGRAFSPAALRGRWSLVFFGFTSCPDVCPTTLQLLSRVAQEPGSGVTAGELQLLFVTVDPATDTPAQIREYLRHFDPRIVGLTGDTADLRRFTDAVGAAARTVDGDGTTFDHSTSLFAIAPEGHLAGVLVNPSDPARILRDLATLRRR